MTDNLDRAQEIEQLHRDNALSRHQTKNAQLTQSLTHCIECNDAIPEARRKAVKTRYCIDCQTHEDKKRKVYGIA